MDKLETQLNHLAHSNSKLKKVIKDKALQADDFLLEMEDSLINDVDTSYGKSYK